MNDTQAEQFLRVATSPPAMEGTTEVGNLVAQFSEVASLVVPRLKVGGLPLFAIVKAIGMIGYFMAKHGKDIDAIVADILALFGKGPKPQVMRGTEQSDIQMPKVGE